MLYTTCAKTLAYFALSLSLSEIWHIRLSLHLWLLHKFLFVHSDSTEVLWLCTFIDSVIAFTIKAALLGSDNSEERSTYIYTYTIWLSKLRRQQYIYYNTLMDKNYLGKTCTRMYTLPVLRDQLICPLAKLQKTPVHI